MQQDERGYEGADGDGGEGGGGGAPGRDRKLIERRFPFSAEGKSAAGGSFPTPRCDRLHMEAPVAWSGVHTPLVLL